MDIGQIESGLVGMALFDAWSNSVHHSRGTQQKRDPLIDAAFGAFEQYISTTEAQHAAMIAGVSAQLGIYALNSQGNGVISQQQMAPLLALNLIA